jgi:hypothetical protein
VVAVDRNADGLSHSRRGHMRQVQTGGQGRGRTAGLRFQAHPQRCCMWLDVGLMGDLPAETMARCRLGGLASADVGSPFGSPISLAPLTFGNQGRLTNRGAIHAGIAPGIPGARAHPPGRRRHACNRCARTSTEVRSKLARPDLRGLRAHGPGRLASGQRAHYRRCRELAGSGIEVRRRRQAGTGFTGRGDSARSRPPCSGWA